MFNKRLVFISLVLVVISISGCATVKVAAPQETIFYPSAPEEPHIQYLTSISSSQDVEGGPGAFAKFILGNEPVRNIAKPYGIKVRGKKIYVADTVYNTIEVIDLAQKTFNYLKPDKAGRLIEPINTDVAKDGTIYAADARRGQVVVLDASGRYVADIGNKGELKPTDVAVWHDRLFVCDLKSRTIRVYALADQQFLYSIPDEEARNSKENRLFSPTNIDVDNDGNVYVTDTGAFKIKEYASSGKFLRAFGIQGDVPGTFARPKGVAADKEGRVYVVDAAFENVQFFDPQGKLLIFFPEQQDQARLVLPAGICITYEKIPYFSKYIDKGFEVDYLIFVTSQYGDRKISVFGFGKRK
ncbi:MAG: hypothetical protein HY210_06425 [Candidatus Omnitrophica bacterium]|nr:hypothetical protein [Candidatus Omnitrophota bacterium]